MINRQRRVRVAVEPLAAFLERVREAVGLHKEELTVCLVSDAAIARLNRTFRGQPGPTDVLSFPINPAVARSRTRRRRTGRFILSPPKGMRNSSSYLGDVAIAPETARRNARRFGRPLAEELRVLILHGVLHLLGYDHETDPARRDEMNRLERRLRRKLGLR